MYTNTTNIFSGVFLSRKISGVSCRSHLCCRDGNRGHARRGGKLRRECLPPPSSPRLAHSIMGGDGEPGLENLSAPFGGCAKPAIVGNFHDGGYTAPESLGIFHRGCAGSETLSTVHHGGAQSLRLSANVKIPCAEPETLGSFHARGAQKPETVGNFHRGRAPSLRQSSFFLRGAQSPRLSANFIMGVHQA